MAPTHDTVSKLLQIGRKSKPADLPPETSPWCSGPTCVNVLLSERDWRTGTCAACRLATARISTPEE